MVGLRPLAQSEDWDYSHGKQFETRIAKRLGTQVHFPKLKPEGSFFMLAVFRRYTFRLEENSVSKALFFVLGGSPSYFHARAESDRQFRFSVASKAVGLIVLNLRRVISDHFDIYFHLSRNLLGKQSKSNNGLQC